jgi:hypothetical protein|tara:strand:- start:444 stop:587 length:144 start_codon:yes stop_codon:yes gene_type:complete
MVKLPAFTTTLVTAMDVQLDIVLSNKVQNVYLAKLDIVNLKKKVRAV